VLNAKSLLLMALVFTLVIVPSAFAVTETVLYSFCSETNCTDGSQPYLGNLVLDSAGNIYGTTEYGGTDNIGVVFKLSPDGDSWKETVLHSFSSDGKDGTNPYAGVIFDKSGNLYGTTSFGGSHGDGIVFELSPEADGRWKETILHNFNDNGKDGAVPYSAPVFDSAGNLYGTTDAGGADYFGAVYKLTPGADGKWTEEVLHHFSSNGKDGEAAVAPLILDASGNLYGTTLLGGSGDAGIVFELSPSASGRWTEKIIHTFNGNDKGGADPYGALAFNSAGDLIGTTIAGGAYQNGTVFELIPDTATNKWTEKILHNFLTSRGTGETPYANVIFDSAGNMYSTTAAGGDGATANGTFFEMVPNTKGGWDEKTLYQFCIAQNCDDGNTPYSGLVLSSSGSFFGTTQLGGINGEGVVYRITK
jgi:uncharacterized repeat protein (TIGR03803 family)